MNDSINEKLRACRLNMGLTQQQVAEKLDVTRQAVTKWESGESLPSTQNLVTLCRLYGVTLEYLTGGTDGGTDDGSGDEPKPQPFWTIEKEAFFVFAVGAVFIAVYFIVRHFDLYPSETLFVTIQAFLFTVSTIITCISDRRFKTKGGFSDIFLPLLLTLGVQVIIGLICEL